VLGNSIYFTGSVIHSWLIVEMFSTANLIDTNIYWHSASCQNQNGGLFEKWPAFHSFTF
jgi:hypothetical protein